MQFQQVGEKIDRRLARVKNTVRSCADIAFVGGMFLVMYPIIIIYDKLGLRVSPSKEFETGEKEEEKPIRRLPVVMGE